MYLCGSFKKGDYKEYIAIWMNINVVDTECNPAIEVWYFTFVFFCPVVLVGSWILSCYATPTNIYCSYTLETWNKYYEIWTNNDRKINWVIIGVEIFNLFWAIMGSILN